MFISSAKACVVSLHRFLSLCLILLPIVQIQASDFQLTVLHTNDVHSRFTQTSKFSGACSDEEATAGKCYGGFPRLHYKVSEIRRTHPNVVYLSGGDYYQGTVWYTIYKWKVVSKFVNWLNHSAMALGNHEFDDDIKGLVPFLNASVFPVLSSNIDDQHEPDVQGLYKKSVVLDIGGRKVGIIGYTTTETMAISNPGSLKFTDEVQAVANEAERLYNEGVKILIAVGHAGYDVDMKIAEGAPRIDCVVGGHTNTFLYSGDAPDVEHPLAEYPTIITQPNTGRKVPVVQAYAFGKYLGYLNVSFNDEGEVTHWGGNPILMDSSIPEDQEMLVELKKWEEDLGHLKNKEVGKTRVFLEGQAIECRLRECNMGNLITDSMIHVNLKYPDELHWSRVSMAMMNSGGIRSSIDEKAKNGSVTLEDVLTVLPFQNTIDLIEIKGKYVREAFEFSVVGYDPKGHHLAGKFLQISGMRVTFDINKPEGSRVVQLLVQCRECRVPQLVPIEDDKVYIMAVPTYVATGGDGYKIIEDNLIKHHLSGILDSDTLAEYLQSRSPIIQGLEDRIRFVESSDSDTSNSVKLYSTNLNLLIIPLLLIFNNFFVLE